MLREFKTVMQRLLVMTVMYSIGVQDKRKHHKQKRNFQKFYAIRDTTVRRLEPFYPICWFSRVQNTNISFLSNNRTYMSSVHDCLTESLKANKLKAKAEVQKSTGLSLVLIYSRPHSPFRFSQPAGGLAREGLWTSGSHVCAFKCLHECAGVKIQF